MQSLLCWVGVVDVGPVVVVIVAAVSVLVVVNGVVVDVARFVVTFFEGL